MFIIVVYLYTVLHIAETLMLRDEDKEPQELGSMDQTMGILIEVT